MSAAIHTRIVSTDEFFPNVIQPKEKEALTPWIFEHADFADLDCIERWPSDSMKFKEFFHLFNTHVTENNLFDTSLAEPDIFEAYYPKSEDQCLEGIEPDLLEEVAGGVEVVGLPAKSWKYGARENSADLMQLQGLMLRTLMETIYLKLKMGGITPRLYFPVTRYKQVYFIGGRKYVARPDCAAMVRVHDEYVPVLSFTGWFLEQTWSEFLGEIMSVMLGQLAHNLKLGLQDQEMFVLGCFKRQIFIARGLFTKDQISRVHSKGFAEDESFRLELTQGYDLSTKESWFEGIQHLVGLLRYFVSGNANVGGLQAHINRE
ncbi:hypothetical protein BO94DRAFT_536478 [Aspergillus sclerotioniger CBS 115572]|uniref:Uncharacterized protein n=1 Tax=Aspergillus sclerotioniger CBS 115572 TaxID=1450535 RepID=A0A317WBS2_9EURO|nr:hypothetical protein BO94DRAFT_536478 [Aspergillus sclerotioniger CBS 115572]PWY83803.1 hypothetical protein BO94DRAFT_536478 [Aspergillus sclerotioniger CBS 115572]